MKNDDYFTNKDNFRKTTNAESIPVFLSKIDYTPKVTIAIPTFKRTNLLKEAIDSAINQVGFRNYDIVVVDNNPERECETERLLASYDEPKLSYYKNSENLGMVGNINRVYHLAQGEYVIELHDDDQLYPNYLHVLMSFVALTGERYDVIFPQKNTYNALRDQEKPKQGELTYLYKQDLKINDFLLRNVALSITHLTRRKCFIEIGGYNEEYYPPIDLDLYVKMTYRYKVCNLHGYPLSVYRVEDNMSREIRSLLGFISKGVEIRRHIVNLGMSKLQKYFWKKYFNAFGYNVLSNKKGAFYREDMDINKELLAIGLDYKKTDGLIYKIICYYYDFLFFTNKTRYKFLGNKIEIDKQ